MKIFRIWLLLALFVPFLTLAQWRQSDIQKIEYISVFGGPYASSNLIWLEITPNGHIRMFNDTYAIDTSFAEFIELGSRAMSAESFREELRSDSLASYYIGNITGNEYSVLTNKIVQMFADTTQLNHHCCCDRPYETAMIYFKSGKKKYMQCGGISNEKTIDLLNFLNIISRKPTYKKATATFKFVTD